MSDTNPTMGRDETLQQFFNKLYMATARVTEPFFILKLADASASQKIQVYRERVYAYELYHQLRCLWDDFPFTMNGEVDKKQHPYFEKFEKIPDLVVHRQGTMCHNLVVVEIKRFEADGFRQDLEKLSWFCDRARYYCGIFLVYGEGATKGAVAEKVSREASRSPKIEMGKIHVLCHQSPLSRAVRVDEINP
jgi:hypothetical protein